MFQQNYVIQLIISAVATLLALSLHEFSHALMANKLGDPTAKSLGRLSVNPLNHLDPFGTLCMIFFHFGWAKPVPINARNFKKPRRDFALTALAGPAANIITGFIVAFIYLVCANLFKYTGNGFLDNLMHNTLVFLYTLHFINIGLGVFNLLPIPPFDGSRLVNVILPPKTYFKIMKYERYIYIGVLVWLLLGTYVYRMLMTFSFISSSPVLSSIVRIFSLTDIVSDTIRLISGLMLKFFALLPFLTY